MKYSEKIKWALLATNLLVSIVLITGPLSCSFWQKNSKCSKGMLLAMIFNTFCKIFSRIKHMVHYKIFIKFKNHSRYT